MIPMIRAGLAGALAFTSAAALAQDVGTTIYGADGKPVGTVAEAGAQVVVIDTGKHKAPVPTNLLFDGPSGKSVNATRDLVDAMMDERIAEAIVKRDAKLVQGAAVISAGGRSVGTLTAVDLAADAIVLEGPQGPVRLRKEHFAVSPQGELMVLYSRDQIAEAAAGKLAQASDAGR
ncbi:hypothetical protein ACLBKU_00735 [Erythrobacter sp. NE805]|uniref:hypothetical protein n=1 Tax=Erythrobacter sp. NE805 TaxID=3389875 RepID=UPI00396B3699